jgi:hypothetical protein
LKVRTREQIAAERNRLRAEYSGLFDEAAAILFELDPIGINFETNRDEYEPEVETILPRLRTCQSREDARKVIHDEFTRWFDRDTAGPESRYELVAERIWAAWQRATKE